MFAYTAACGTRNHLLSVIAQILAHAALYCVVWAFLRAIRENDGGTMGGNDADARFSIAPDPIACSINRLQSVAPYQATNVRP